MLTSLELNSTSPNHESSFMSSHNEMTMGRSSSKNRLENNAIVSLPDLSDANSGKKQRKISKTKKRISKKVMMK